MCILKIAIILTKVGIFRNPHTLVTYVQTKVDDDVNL